MNKMNYNAICKMLNVTNKDIEAKIEESNKQTEPVYESEKFGFDWIANVVNPGCKLSATEIGRIWKSLKWVKRNEHRKYFELSSIASMLFCYRVNELNEPFTK